MHTDTEPVSVLILLVLLITISCVHCINKPICSLTTSNESQHQCILDQSCHEDITRYIIIGDIHGSYDGLLEILYNANITQAESCIWKDQTIPVNLLSVGDLVDRGTHAYEAWKCLDHLQSTAPKLSNVIRLIGNHDIWWLQGYFNMINKETDTQSKIMSVISSMKRRILNKSIVGSYITRINNIPILFTHAGLRPEFIQYLQLQISIDEPENISTYINDLVMEETKLCRKRNQFCEFEDELFQAGKERGGKNIGGPFWTDFSVLQASYRRLPNDLIQIVGHSASDCAFSDEPNRDEECIRHTANGGVICVDGGMVYGGRSYLEIDIDGHIVKHQKDFVSSVWETHDITNTICGDSSL